MSPVIKCGNGKWKIGSGNCMYDSKEIAEKAYKGYKAHKHMNELKDEITSSKEDLKLISLELNKQKNIVIKYVKS